MTPTSSIRELTVQDSLESIFDTLKEAVTAHRDGYRVSINFTGLRPRGDIITSVQKPSEGAVSFLKIFDRALATINSRTPKELPNIAILRVDHPDILEFLSYETQLTIKVGVTQEFIQAVENDAMYSLIDPRTGETVNKLNARSVYDLISEKTSSGNESGILYLDNVKPVERQSVDKQEALPFNDTARAEEIIPPPVINLA